MRQSKKAAVAANNNTFRLFNMNTRKTKEVVGHKELGKVLYSTETSLSFIVVRDATKGVYLTEAQKAYAKARTKAFEESNAVPAEVKEWLEA